MYKLNTITKDKAKAQGVGFWFDKAEKRLYKDYIKVKYYRYKKDLDKGVKALFKEGEKAVFYTVSGCGVIVYANGKREVLSNKHIFRVNRLYLGQIKGIIKAYGGLTIYRLKGGQYTLEAYK